MTRKRQDDLFSSTALALPTHASASNLVPFERSRELVKAERKVTGEAHKQRLVIQEQRRITDEADWAIAHLSETAMQSFTASAESVWAIKTAPGRDAELQAYIDQYADHNIRACGNYIRAATDVGDQRIIEEVGRSLYFETEEERRGLLARLRGE